MSVNTMGFEQASTLLNSIHSQATGKAAITPTTTSDFVSLAQTTLQAGYDPVLNAISQMVTKTIFSVRPYNRKFAGLQVDNQKFGAITRKLNIADKDFENDSSFALVDGQAIDHYVVNKPNVLQTNFYGANVFEKSYTIFKDQLDNAFTGPEQFGEFMSMVTQNASDMVEQAHENLSRATIANYIGGKVAGDTASVIHLLTEYNTATGQSLTKADAMLPANYKAFMQWVYARVAALCSLMTERSNMFQTNVTGKPVMRHTPYENQNVYMFAPDRYGMEARVLADTFHDNYLKYADVETVNFWQSILTPEQISVTPSYLDNTGAIVTGSAAVIDDIFGVIVDDDTLGYTVVNQWSAMTPLNAKGGYWNMFLHFTDRYWTDYTEKGVVLKLD